MAFSGDWGLLSFLYFGACVPRDSDTQPVWGTTHWAVSRPQLCLGQRSGKKNGSWMGNPEPMRSMCPGLWEPLSGGRTTGKESLSLEES